MMMTVIVDRDRIGRDGTVTSVKEVRDTGDTGRPDDPVTAAQ